MANAFALGYRRYGEVRWLQSAFALRPPFGFTYEGLFRQAIVNKGRNRDTSWFSIIDGDWNGGLNAAYLRWLAEDNFDAGGAQKLRLSDLTAPFVHARS